MPTERKLGQSSDSKNKEGFVMETEGNKRLCGKERIASLNETFPELPTSILLKTDVVRHGVRFTPVLPRIDRWALPQTHLNFEWDH